jgi:hypothetical protein
MERGTTNHGLRAVATIVAAVAGVSCGTGIRDGEGHFFVSKDFDESGGQLALREAVLDIGVGDMPAAGIVTLRRYDEIELGGAVGPVFQIEAPTPSAFVNDPHLSIATSPAIAGATTSTIGALPLVEGSVVGQWTPNAVDSAQTCTVGSVCGRVQRASFLTSRGGTRTVFFAIVQRCVSPAECPSGQTCTSAACQDCPKEVPCNP